MRQNFRSDQKYRFCLAPIGLKFSDQAFLDLEIQKIRSVWLDSFQKLYFSVFSYHFSSPNFESTVCNETNSTKAITGTMKLLQLWSQQVSRGWAGVQLGWPGLSSTRLCLVL